MTRPAVRPMAATVLVATAGVLPVFLTGAVSVKVRRDLGFGAGGVGLATGAFFVTAAVFSSALGPIAERLGPVRSMRLSSLASGVALLAVAVVARSFASLAVVLAAADIAHSLAQPATNVFVARTVAAGRQGLAFALKQNAIPVATLLGGLAVPTLALPFGWRWAYVAAAALAWCALALVPDDVEGRVSSRRAAAGGGRPALAPLAVLGAGVGMGAAAAASLGTFYVSAAVHAGLAEAGAGVLAASGSAICAVARVVHGLQADRREGGHLSRVAVLLAVGAVGYAVAGSGNAVALVAATPVLYAAAWGWPGLFNYAVVAAHPTQPGAATGVTQTGTYLGAVTGPVLFGVVAERSGYQVAWWVAGAFAGCAAGLMVAGGALLRRTHAARAVPA